MNLYRFLEPGETPKAGDEFVFYVRPFGADARAAWTAFTADWAVPLADYNAGSVRRLVIDLPDHIEPAETDPCHWVRLTTDKWVHQAQWVKRDDIPRIIAALLAAWQASAR